MADLQQFITILKPTRPEMLSIGLTAFEEQIISDHFCYLEERVKTGIVLLAGRTLTEDENTFGIVISQGKDLDDARNMAANDPAIINGVMLAEVLPFRISLPLIK